MSDGARQLSGLSELLEVVVVLLGGNDILLLLVAQLWEELLGDELQEEVDEERDEAQANTEDPLRKSNTLLVDLESFSSESHDGDLTEEDDHPDSHEQPVGEDALKDVKLVVDLSSTEHVEDLEEHEQVEDERQVSRVSCSLKVSVHVGSIKALNGSIKDELVARIHLHSVFGFFSGDVISLHVGVTIWVN